MISPDEVKITLKHAGLTQFIRFIWTCKGKNVRNNLSKKYKHICCELIPRVTKCYITFDFGYTSSIHVICFQYKVIKICFQFFSFLLNNK